MIRGVAGLENSLQRRKSLDLHLRRQNFNFIVVQKFEKRNVSQLVGIAWHGLPHS
jgi:outer membrane lipoprotein SlyB